MLITIVNGEQVDFSKPITTLNVLALKKKASELYEFTSKKLLILIVFVPLIKFAIIFVSALYFTTLPQSK